MNKEQILQNNDITNIISYLKYHNQLMKTTFLQRSEKCIKYFDRGYHLHKSTFKGLAQFFKEYNEIEKEYSTRLNKLTYNLPSQVEEFHNQMPLIQSILKEFINCLQTKSLLHFNYSQRLGQVSSYYTSEYQNSKKLKEKIMGMVKNKNEEQYERAKDKKDRNLLNLKQKQICQSYYDNLQKYYDEEAERTRKIKEQFIIYLSISKKVIEKEQEATKGYSDMLNMQQPDIVCNNIQNIQKMIIDQYNGYGQGQLHPTKFTKHQFMQDLKRSSIRDSIIMKEKVVKTDSLTNQLKNFVGEYRQLVDSNSQSRQPSKLYGLFDSLVTKDKGVYARQVVSSQLKILFYEMMHRYWLGVGDSQSNLNIQTIKSKLKLLNCKPTKPAITFKNFIQDSLIEQRSQLSKWHINFLLFLNPIFQNSNYDQINAFIKKKKKNYQGQIPEHFSLQISIVAIDTLLQSLFQVNDQAIIYSSYMEILPTIYQFGKKYLHISYQTTLLLFLRTINRILQINQEATLQYLQDLNKVSLDISEVSEQQNLTQINLTYDLYNCMTQNILNFFANNFQLINIIKICLLLEKVGNFLTQFSAMEHFHKTLKLSGFIYLQKSDQDACLEGSTFKGNQRLRNLIRILDQLQFQKIDEVYFEPTSGQLSKILGVGRHALQVKMLQQFMQPCLKIIHSNIKLLLEQGGVDKQGYILRLGTILSKIDHKNPKSILYYTHFFQALQLYLSETQKDYNNLLQKSRQTQLWLVEDNAQATQNCIDFCSLLSKPFQFLLTSLKELESHKELTQFQIKYSNFIRLRLNTILKQQIMRYLQFLYNSLNSIVQNQADLILKPKRYQKIQKLNTQQFQKQKKRFKQVGRRLYNLLFLKEQIQQMVCDFLQRDIYQLLDNSIFNIDKVKKVASQSTGQIKQILNNIDIIVTNVIQMERKLVERIADITILHFWKQIFINLYFQEQKGAFTQFFASKDDYKLSQFTFVSMQSRIQQDFTLIAKNIPQDFIDRYSSRFCQTLYKSIRNEILNANKFKIPINQKQIVMYLQTDQSHIISIMKRRFFDQKVVQQKLQKPLKKLLQDFISPTNKLIDMFEQATLKNDKKNQIYILIILNLRHQERAQEFVKKYKNTVIQK